MISASTRANPLISTLPRILTWPRFGFRTICSGRLGFAPYTSMPEASPEELRTILPGKKEVEIFTEEFEIGSRVITLETRNIARFANGAAGLKMDETRVLATVIGPRGDALRDFLPLTVDYQEKQYAQGMIPKSFMRREGGITERELLVGRLIDRPIRPLFPPGFYHEMQVMASVLSSDGKQDPDVMAVNATSAALMLSDIPWGGPIGVIRIGRICGQFVVNPSVDELKSSDLSLVYACSKDKTLMIDVQGREVPEKVVIAALKVAHPEAVKYLEPQIRLASKAGKQKKEYKLFMVSEKTKEKIRNLSEAPIESVFTDPSYEKAERGKALDRITQDVRKKLEEESDAEGLEALSKTVDTVRKEVIRRRVLSEGLRVDGRRFDEVRQLECKAGILPLLHGSSLFSRGETQVLGTVTLGAPDDSQHLNSLVGPRSKRFMLHYSFPPYCTNEPGKLGGLSRREVGHGALAEKALLAVLPSEDTYPYTIRINADVMASEGSTSMAAACAGSMALMDAGVPIKTHVGGISVGLVSDIDPLTGETKAYRILTDILGLEDHVGDIDFKIAGTRHGVTAMQLDMKLPGIPLDIICECLEPARKGRLHILDHMENEINEPRSQDDRISPRLVTLKYSNDAIRRIIGPLGALKKNIEEETGVRISVDDGKLILFAKSQSIMEKAQEKIEVIVGREILSGEIYKGVVTSIKEYGAFVELNGGHQGLLHISELSHDPVSRVSDVLSIGQRLEFMCLGQDVRGNIKLSLKSIRPVSGSKPKKDAVGSYETPINNKQEEPSDIEQENKGSFPETQPPSSNGTKKRDSSSTAATPPEILIRSVEECDAEEKSEGLDALNKSKRSSSKTGDKKSSKKSTKSTAEDKKVVLEGPPPMSAKQMKIGVELTAKVHQIRTRGLVLDLGGGIHGMYRFETERQTDFVVGDELPVKCSSFSSKGVPILTLAGGR